MYDCKQTCSSTLFLPAMLSHIWHGVAMVMALASRASSTPILDWDSHGNMTMAEISATIPNVAQLHITTMAAIGDSYSTGIGAGDMLITGRDGK